MIKKQLSAVFINSLYYPNIGGGAEIIMQKQIEGLHELGYQVTVLTTTDKKGISEDVVNGVRVIRVGLENFYWHYSNKKPDKLLRMGWHLRDIYNRKMALNAKKIIRKINPSIIFTHNITGWSVAIFKEIHELKIPVVQVLHDQYFRCPNSNMFKNDHACVKQCFICKLMRFPHKMATQNVSMVVGVSSFILNEMLNAGYFRGVQSDVIYNANDVDKVEKELMFDSQKPLIFGFIGTIAKAKGIEWLIDEFIKLKIDSTLLIGGRGDVEYVEALKKKAGDNPRIKFLGYVKSSEFYTMIDISIVPSIWPDTFPGVAYEAAAHSVPVVATKIGGLPEIIKHEKNGLLCDPDNRNSLPEAILRLNNDRELTRSLAMNARESVKHFLSTARMINEYVKVSEKMTNM